MYLRCFNLQNKCFISVLLPSNQHLFIYNLICKIIEQIKFKGDSCSHKLDTDLILLLFELQRI